MPGAGRAATLPRRAAVPGRRLPAGAIRAVAADEAELMHVALRSLLAAVPGCALVAAASTVGTAEQLVRRLRPDLLICDTDIAGASGIGLCRQARLASPVTRVAILTSRDEPLLAQSALAAGAHAYLLKDSAPEDLAAYLQDAAGGLRTLDPRLGRARPGERRTEATDEFGLSRREREVLGELLAGLDNKRIAGRLHISEDTVKSHVKAIFRKLGARDRAHAVALALGTAMVAGQPLHPVAGIPAPRRRAGR
jgi:DNA-binding NarL/FixJ family response regulator